MTDSSIPDVAARRASPRAARALAAAVSVAAALAVWLIAVAAGLDLSVSSPVAGTLTIDLLLVLATAVPAALAAWGVLVLIERRSSRPARTWWIVSIVVLAISLPPLAFLSTPLSTTLALGAMHLAQGIPLIVLLGRTIRERAS